MSRNYKMECNITGYCEEREPHIINAFVDNWAFDDCDIGKGRLKIWGESCLQGGETEDEFVDRMSYAIWEANEAYCAVEISCIYLDDPPTEVYSLDEDDYAKWKEIK